MGEKFDSRYRDLSATVTQYNLQNNNGILASLKALPEYNKGDEALKQNTIFRYWGRPTIDWKLECEANVSRSDAIKSAVLEKGQNSLNEGVVKAMLIMPLIFGCCFNCCVGTAFLNDKLKREEAYKMRTKVIWSCCGLCNMIPVIIACAYMYRQQSALLVRLVSMKKFMEVNGCSDVFTQVPESFVDQIQQARDHALYAMIEGLCVLLLSITAICCCVACIKWG